MDKDKAQALQVAKEIMVKFVEVGRISPGNFADYFGPIYAEVLRTITLTDAGRPSRPDEDDGKKHG